MQIHHQELSDVNRYLENRAAIQLEDKEDDFEFIMGRIRQFKTVDENTRLLEIGTGLGWLPVLCKIKGIDCKGIEISPQLVEYGKQFGRRNGVEPDIELGNIEDFDFGDARFDVIIATSVFEHVERWQRGLSRVFDALKPGGLLFFYSTSKFAFGSGEFDFPMYNWLPDRWRYRLRVARQGEDIMKLGIDFNQFTCFGLRRFFNKLGFSRVFDQVDIMDPDRLVIPKTWKKVVLKVLKRVPLLKHAALVFASGTSFICIK